jgi:hypothetical protein
MENLRASADVFKVLEAWTSAFFLLTMVANVLCSGKFLHSRQIKVLIRARRGDCLEDVRRRKFSSKLDNHLANHAHLRREQHTVRLERHRGAYNILEQF